jgi:hypothetical protein
VIQRVDSWKAGDAIHALGEEENVILNRMRKVFAGNDWKAVHGLKAKDRSKVMREVKLVNALFHDLLCEDMSISDVNSLLYTESSRLLKY